VWQGIREQLKPKGFELVTVSLDNDGGGSRRWIEAAAPGHPSLIDRTHRLAALFGVTNVPSGIWIDESGVVVRPAEPAFPGRPAHIDQPERQGAPGPAHRGLRQMGRRIAGVLEERGDYEKYTAALRDWVDNGVGSRHVLAERARERAGLRTRRQAIASAHFELGLHLLATGRTIAARRHLLAATRLHPANWTYKRQAWSLDEGSGVPASKLQQTWLRHVRRAGAESYYPPLDL
jgi:hypothetical protein